MMGASGCAPTSLPCRRPSPSLTRPYLRGRFGSAPFITKSGRSATGACGATWQRQRFGHDRYCDCVSHGCALQCKS
jgi:hypothetical protein